MPLDSEALASPLPGQAGSCLAEEPMGEGDPPTLVPTSPGLLLGCLMPTLLLSLFPARVFLLPTPTPLQSWNKEQPAYLLGVQLRSHHCSEIFLGALVPTSSKKHVSATLPHFLQAVFHGK